MTNIKKLQAVYDIIHSQDNDVMMIKKLRDLIAERPIVSDASVCDGMPEDGSNIHNALMHGLDEYGINYESDGETYWIDCQDGDTRFVGIDVCAK